jgi:preprotein translocase subunit SecA
VFLSEQDKFQAILEDIEDCVKRGQPVLVGQHEREAHNSGDARGLDGQALRWCTQDELEAAELLPADRPIVRALRLPERLRQMASRYYCVGDLS